MAALATALEALGATTMLVPAHGLIQAELLVVDSYLRAAGDDPDLRANAVVAIDDLGRDLAVDLLVDPNPGRPAGTAIRSDRQLLGFEFALLARDLAPGPPGDVPGRVESIFLTTGLSSESGGLALDLAEELAIRQPRLEVRATCPVNRGPPPTGVTKVATRDGLGPELTRADIVVTAGGVSMLESLALGRPTVAIVTAENQWRAVAGAASAGAVVVAQPDEVGAILADLIANAGTRGALSAAARRLIDGKGAERVAQAMSELLP